MYPEFPYLGFKEECEKIPITFPSQHQDTMPAIEAIMEPKPIFDNIYENLNKGKLQNKVAIITGGDSGIGRAVCIKFAKEGANICFTYFDDLEKQDALVTKECVEDYGVKCLMLKKDLTNSSECQQVVSETINMFGKIDILVNNCGIQYVKDTILDISDEQLEKTFKTNIFSYFYMTKHTLPFLKENSCIINTSSVNSFRGNKKLIDYSATKGAITNFTKSMSSSLANQGIRVNEVAPGPIWTPLIPGSFSKKDVEVFGSDVPLKRAGQPFEVSGAYLYLACDDSRYVTGQTIHVNGGTII